MKQVFLLFFLISVLLVLQKISTIENSHAVQPMAFYVNTRHACYPITIDLLNTTASAMVESNQAAA